MQIARFRHSTPFYLFICIPVFCFVFWCNFSSNYWPAGTVNKLPYQTKIKKAFQKETKTKERNESKNVKEKQREYTRMRNCQMKERFSVKFHILANWRCVVVHTKANLFLVSSISLLLLYITLQQFPIHRFLCLFFIVYCVALCLSPSLCFSD